MCYFRYGGEMLGPARFNHIETCTREACRAFRLRDELEEHVATLRSLDDILGALRDDLAAVRQSRNAPEDSKPSSKKSDYKSLLESSDIDKVKRLVSAREKAINSVKLSLQREKVEGKADASGSNSAK
jgi:hypothetical protein